MPPIKGHVVFDEVSFGYGVESKHQLSGISLDIPAGSLPVLSAKAVAVKAPW